MPIALQQDFVYGPIHSRRFGNSLGINLLPTGEKVCNFDCVYCQYGATGKGEHPVFPGSKAIEEAVRDYLSDIREQGLEVNWIMLSGNGEPTLHPDFSRIVDELKNSRDIYLPGVPVGILSNSSTCYRSDIRDALSRLDGRFMKLDAGSFRVFRKIDLPALGLTPAWADIVSGLYHLPKVVLQSLFITGVVDNTSPKDLDEWIETVRYISPLSVQVYSVSRPTRLEGVLPVARPKLEDIARLLTNRTGIAATVYD